MKRIESVGIIGMGALGLLYAKQITEGLGKNHCFFAMDSDRFEKYKNQEFFINEQKYDFEIKDCNKCKPVDLVMVCTKSTGLESAISVMKNLVGPETIILSVLNGISSEKIIAETYGMDHLVYSVAQGMDAMKFGNKLNFTKQGQLHIGFTKDTKDENVSAVKEFFDRAKVPYIFEEDINYRMWSKFMLNVGVNQTCMVYNTTYSGVLEEGSEANRTYLSAMREVIAIAHAEGIPLTEKDVTTYVDITRGLKPTGTPSMGQDRINKKHSEVEMFAGTVIKMAAKHNILVPVNQFLYNRVKEIEKEY